MGKQCLLTKSQKKLSQLFFSGVGWGEKTITFDGSEENGGGGSFFSPSSCPFRSVDHAELMLLFSPMRRRRRRRRRRGVNCNLVIPVITSAQSDPTMLVTPPPHPFCALSIESRDVIHSSSSSFSFSFLSSSSSFAASSPHSNDPLPLPPAVVV